MGRAARLTGFAIVAIAVVAAAGFLLLPLAVQGFVRGLTLTLNAGVWLAASLSTGADAWTILKTVGSAAGTALTSPQAFIVGGGLVVVGGLAMYGLQRLLGSDEESPR
jgi:hypothetical protein